MSSTSSPARTQDQAALQPAGPPPVTMTSAISSFDAVTQSRVGLPPSGRRDDDMPTVAQLLIDDHATPFLTEKS